MSSDFNMLLKEIESLPYKVSQIKFRFFEKNNARKILFLKYFKPGTNKCYNVVKIIQHYLMLYLKLQPILNPIYIIYLSLKMEKKNIMILRLYQIIKLA